MLQINLRFQALGGDFLDQPDPGSGTTMRYAQSNLSHLQGGGGKTAPDGAAGRIGIGTDSSRLADGTATGPLPQAQLARSRDQSFDTESIAQVVEIHVTRTRERQWQIQFESSGMI